MKFKFWSLILFLFCSVNTIFAQMQNPVHWSYEISPIQSNGTVTVTFSASIDEPWHMYDVKEPENGPVPTSFKFAKLQNAEVAGEVVAKSKLIKKFEPAFGMELSYYENVAVFQQKLKVKNVSADVVAEGAVEYMCCDDQMCLPPTKAKFALTAKGLEKVAASTPATVKETTPAEPVEKKKNEPNEVKELSSQNPSVNEQVKTPVKDTTIANSDTVSVANTMATLTAYGEDDSGNSTLWTIFLSGLLGGFLAVLTPCVWPIIPMTVTFFMKRDSGRKQVFLYGLSIIVIYVSLGLIITSLFSANTLNALGTNAFFNIFLFLLLIFFACSFFGGFEIMFPASWSTAIDAKAEKLDSSKDKKLEDASPLKHFFFKKLSGVLGILLMACTLVLVSFSCTGPIIGTLLVSVSIQGDILAPAIGMFGFALALAIPFTVFAFFPSLSNKAKKASGSWQNMVKVLLGFFELAFSLKFLSVADQAYGWGLLSRPTFIAIWIVIFVLAGIYLLGKLKLSHDTDIEFVSVPRLLMALASFAFAIYLLPGMFGAPLNVISAFAPPHSKTDASFYPEKVVEAQFADYDEAQKAAVALGKPLLLDFTGYGCVNCRKMETAVWTNPEVANLMNDKCILVSLYCDDRTPLKEKVKVKENNGEETELETIGEKWSFLQRSKFGANAQPYYVMVSPDGKVYKHYFKFTENANDFKNYILDGIESLFNSVEK